MGKRWRQAAVVVLAPALAYLLIPQLRALASRALALRSRLRRPAPGDDE